MMNLLVGLVEVVLMLAFMTFVNGIMTVLLYVMLPFKEEDEHMTMAALVSGALLALMIYYGTGTTPEVF